MARKLGSDRCANCGWKRKEHGTLNHTGTCSCREFVEKHMEAVRTLNILRCPRCTKEHKDVAFRRLRIPLADFLWGTCPVTQEPLLDREFSHRPL